MEVLILVGISGSGKTTFAKNLIYGQDITLCSADDFFTNVAGRYVFEPENLKKAHEYCFDLFSNELRIGKDVILDNTNLEKKYLSRYIGCAKYYGANITVVVFLCDVDAAFYSNVHNVPYYVLIEQDKKLEDLLSMWPIDWPHPVKVRVVK